MYRPPTPGTTNAPNSHPGRVRNSPSDNPQLSPALTEWNGYELISLLPRDIFLADPDTKVRHFRIPTQHLDYRTTCTPEPLSNEEDQFFARFRCTLPPVTPDLQQPAIYVISEETLHNLMVACYLHHTALPFRIAVPTDPVYAIGGPVLGYATLTVVDRPAI